MPGKIKVNIKMFYLAVLLIIVLFLMHTIVSTLNSILNISPIVILMPCLAIVFLIFPSKIRIRIRLVAIAIFFGGFILVQTFLPILQSPDSIAFYQNLTNFSFSGLREKIYATFDLFSLGLVSSRLTFPLLLSFFFSGITTLSPSSIIIINFLFWFTATFWWIDLVERYKGQIHGIYKSHIFKNILFLLMIASSSPIYWSSVFAKDILATSMTIFATLFLCKKKYVLAFLVVVIATLLRPYAIALIVCFYCFLNYNSKKLNSLLVLSSVSIVFISTNFSMATFSNIPMNMAYFFMSPIPFDGGNWVLFKDAGTWHFSPIIFTIEGTLYSIILVFSFFIFLTKKGIRQEYLQLAGLFSIVAAVLVLVAFVRVDVDFGFFKVGENLVRKKFIAWPLLTVWGAITLTYLTRLINEKILKKKKCR